MFSDKGSNIPEKSTCIRIKESKRRSVPYMMIELFEDKGDEFKEIVTHLIFCRH